MADIKLLNIIKYGNSVALAIYYKHLACSKISAILHKFKNAG